MSNHEKLSDKFIYDYRADREKDLPPCPPVKKEQVLGIDGTWFPQDLNAQGRRAWKYVRYFEKVQAHTKVGSTRKYAAGWEAIFGSSEDPSPVEQELQWHTLVLEGVRPSQINGLLIVGEVFRRFGDQMFPQRAKVDQREIFIRRKVEGKVQEVPLALVYVDLVHVS